MITEEIENEIIKLYNDGIGSTTITKLLQIPKKEILSVLHNRQVFKTKKHINGEYDDYWFDNDQWYSYWTCQQCGDQILCHASTKHCLYRNIKKKKICKKCSLEKQIGIGNPFYGKQHTDDTKQKISDKRAGIRTSDHMSKPEYRELFRKIGKARWDNKNMDVERKRFSDLMKEMHRSGKMKSVIRSKTEKEICQKLTDMGIECINSFRIETKIFDIFLPQYNLIIEYNGDYWHCNPDMYSFDYWNGKKQKNCTTNVGI